MKLRNLIVGLAAGAALVTTGASASAAPEQASARTGEIVDIRTHATDARSVRHTTPSAPPAGALTATDLGVAAASPGISPWAKSIHLPSGTDYTCSGGNFCAEVWDPSTGSWEIFFLYYCNRYYVSNWYNWGDWVNNQTTGTVARVYGGSGQLLWSHTAKGWGAADWTPVYSIRNC